MKVERNNFFQPKTIKWLPDNRYTILYIRDFQDALYELLSNEILMQENNLSFPNINHPFLSVPSEFAEIITNDIPNNEKKDSYITKLHDGIWWKNSWKKLCAPNSNEILVPVIFYMDSISTDNNGKLNLTRFLIAVK